MDNTALEQPDVEFDAETPEQLDDREVAEQQPQGEPAEPLYGDFLNEIEIWARRALASNGFGDY